MAEFERTCFTRVYQAPKLRVSTGRYGQDSSEAIKEQEAKNFLRMYRKFIGQASTAEDHKERIARMVNFCAEQDDSTLA